MSDRRSFFSEASQKSLDQFTKRFGLKFSLKKEAASTAAQTSERPLLRSGSPINERGDAFGGSVSGMAIVPFGLDSEGALLVCGHYGEIQSKEGTLSKDAEANLKKSSFGISILELRKTNGQWDLVSKSSRNIRISAANTESLSVEGAIFDKENAKLNPVYFESKTVAPIMFVTLTPWQTVLCAEKMIDDDSGWVIEVSPRSGSVVKRNALGRVDARSLEFVASQSDKKTHLKMVDASGKISEFVSFQNTNERALNCGDVVEKGKSEFNFSFPAGLKIQLDASTEIVCMNGSDGRATLSIIS